MALPRLLPALLLAVLALPAAGCGPLGALRSAAAPLDSYTLAPAAFRSNLPSTGRHLVVEPPAASGAIDTDRILVQPSPLEVRYLPGARWIDPAPILVQSLLVETLQNTGAFRFVSRAAVGPFPDYTLMTELIDFQAEPAPDPELPVQVRVTIETALVREADGSIVSSRRFTTLRPATGLDTVGVIAAFNAATDEVLSQAATWVLSLFGLRGA